MTWVKGQSGNLAGKPPGKKPIVGGIKSELTLRFGSLENGAAAIGAELVNIALDKQHPKQIQALQEIVDRLDGKAVQSLATDPDNPLFPSNIEIVLNAAAKN